MILYFDKYGTLIMRDNEGETWVQGDDQSYSLKAKFYDDTQANITEDTPFIDLSNYVVNCVVEREDGSTTPTLTMNRFDENTGAKVLVDNWWTEINGNITVTIRLVDIVDNSVKATGLATITINRGNVPSDTTITNSEKAALENAIASKEDNSNKTTNVRTEQQASDVLYPSEKAVAKVRTALNEIINLMASYIENVKTTADANESNITAINTTIVTIRSEIDSLSAEDTRINEKITSIEREIGNLVIGADFVPKTRTIAEISLENNITKQELVEAIISLFGSAAQVDTGYTANTIPVIQNDGKLPKNIIPINDGLIYGGAIESVGNYEAIVYPSDAFIVKYPDTPTDDTITINRETTEYTDVYFVVQGAASEGDTILGIEGVQNGDWIIANAERGFLKIDNVDAVKSVNGMLGVVVIKPKDLILENYSTSELDDNNIYPTDSAQTGISKLDARTKELEEKVSVALPNVVLEIANLDVLTASEQDIIIEQIKSITNDLTTDLDTTKFSEVVLRNDVGTTEAPDLRQYSLVSYEHKKSDPTYYKFTFNLDDNTEYELFIRQDLTVSVNKLEFATKAQLPTKTSQLTNDSEFIDSSSKELVKEVETIETPTGDSTHVIFQEGKAFVRSYVIGDGVSINLPAGVTTAEYPYYHIIKTYSGFKVVWAKDYSVSSGYSGAYRNYASIHVSISSSLYYSTLNYSTVAEAIDALKASNTEYTYDENGTSFTVNSNSSSTSSTQSTSASCPVVRSNYYTEFTYYRSVSYTVTGPSTRTSTSTGITPVDGVVNDGSVFNEYKELSTKEYVDEQIGNINAILDAINGEVI